MNGMEWIGDYHISGPIKANLEEIKELQRNKGPVLTGLPTGFTLVDRITSGLNNSDLIILASFPLWNKTSFALNIARNVAVNQGVPVLIFSLEATEEQLSMQMLRTESRVVPTMAIMKGSFGEEEWDRIRKASDILAKAPIYIDASPGISLSTIEVEGCAIKEKTGSCLIIIDYFQLLRGDIGAPNQRADRTDMAAELKRLAEKLDVPILLIFQLAEVDLEVHNQRPPSFIDLAEAGSFDQDADQVLLISYDYVIHPFARNFKRGEAEIIIAKNRRGSKGMVRLKFTYEYGLFEDFVPSP